MAPEERRPVTEDGEAASTAPEPPVRTHDEEVFTNYFSSNRQPLLY